MYSIRRDLGGPNKRVKINIREIPDKDGRILRTLKKGECLEMTETIRDCALEQRWMRVTMSDGSVGYCLLEDQGVILLEEVEGVNHQTLTMDTPSEPTYASHVILARSSSHSPVSPPQFSPLSDQYFFPPNVGAVAHSKEECKSDDDAGEDSTRNSFSLLQIFGAVNDWFFRLFILVILIFALAVSINLFFVTVLDLPGWRGPSSLDAILLAH